MSKLKQPQSHAASRRDSWALASKAPSLLVPHLRWDLFCLNISCVFILSLMHSLPSPSCGLTVLTAAPRPCPLHPRCLLQSRASTQRRAASTVTSRSQNVTGYPLILTHSVTALCNHAHPQLPFLLFPDTKPPTETNCSDFVECSKPMDWV